MRVTVKLVEKASGRFVDAELFDEVTEEHLLQAEEQWRPMLREPRRRLPPELRPRNAHWDWTSKDRELALLANTFYAIQLEGKMQGLMKVETVGHVCRLPEQSGKELVYVDYLETAPWNIKALMSALGEQPKYALIGTRLVEAAVRQSFEEGFKELRRRDAGFFRPFCSVDLFELVNIENEKAKPKARTVYQIANFLGAPEQRLVALAALLELKDVQFQEESVRFAARERRSKLHPRSACGV